MFVITENIMKRPVSQTGYSQWLINVTVRHQK